MTSVGPCVIHFSTDGLLKGLARGLLAVAVFASMVAVAHCGSGCRPPSDPTEAERNYTAALVGCSATAHTKEEAKACRHAVNVRFGLCEQTQWPRVTPCDE